MEGVAFRAVSFACALLFLCAFSSPPVDAVPESDVPASDACALMPGDPDPPLYYRIDLVPTRRVPGTARATGFGDVTFAASPFGVAISNSGTYVYDLRVSVERLREPKSGAYVVWISTPDLDTVQRLGALEDGEIRSRVAWNKFLVIVTLEEEDDAAATIWSGPVILRGMSRSGLMHTMAGHGPFESEPCAQYGYK